MVSALCDTDTQRVTTLANCTMLTQDKRADQQCWNELNWESLTRGHSQEAPQKECVILIVNHLDIEYICIYIQIWTVVCGMLKCLGQVMEACRCFSPKIPTAI